MQVYFPHIKTKQGTIGFFDYLVACKESRESNVIFNSDLNLEDLNIGENGNERLADGEPADDSSLEFLGHILCNFSANTGQLFQDLYVQWKLKNKKDGVFFEVGTGHPDFKNNTFSLEQDHGWQGVCVEPNPAFHPMISSTRSSPLETAAIFSQPKSQITLRVYQKFDAGGGIDDNYEFKPDLEHHDDISWVEAPTISLVDCLKKHSIGKKFDYLSYDTTGNIDDVESITQMLKAGYQPSVITVGHNYKSQRSTLCKVLQENGYQQEFDYLSRWDDWYFHSSVLST